MEENINKPEEKKISPMTWRSAGMKSWVEKQAGRPLKTSDKVIGVILLVIFLFVFYVALDANKYAMQVLVIEGEGKVGVNPTQELLDFGDMSKGTTAVRTVTLQNGTFMPMKILVWQLGGITDLVDIAFKEDGRPYESFKLKPDTEVKLDFVANMPASVQPGTKYTGRVFILKIPTFGL